MICLPFDGGCFEFDNLITGVGCCLLRLRFMLCLGFGLIVLNSKCWIFVGI